MKDNIKGNVALVTGASRGIGAAISLKLIQCGIGKIVVVARDTKRFSLAVEEFVKEASNEQEVIPIRTDFSSPEAVELLVEQVINMNNNIDILVNNAGFTAPRTIFEATFAEFQQTINVNLFAPFLITQGLLRNRNIFSHIFNIASTAGIKGRAGWSTYSSSKAGLIAFSESLREELLPVGTRVTCFSPGRCATDLRKTLAPNEDPSTIMQPEDVADVMAMLLTDVGHFIDSENMVVRL